MGRRIRLANTSSSAIEKAIIKAEKEGYDLGFSEATSLHENLSRDNVNEIAVLTSKINQLELYYKSRVETLEATIKELRRQQVLVGTQNRELKEHLADRNRELTKIRQVKASAVTETMSRRRRRSSKSMRHRMKEEDDEFYG